MPRNLWIRPVFKVEGDNERLLSIALCTTNLELLVDEQILEHFPVDTFGVDIQACGKEFHNASTVEWGNTIQTK